MAPRTKPGATNARTAKTSDSPATKPQQQAALGPAQPAQVKPASDPTPAGANTCGKVCPQTSPNPNSNQKKARTKAERDAEIAKYEQERRDALARGDKKAAQEADLKAAQVMDEPKTLGDIGQEAGGILGKVFGARMGKGRGRTNPRNTTASPAPAPASKPTATPAPPPANATPTTANGSGGGYSKGTRRRPKHKCELMPYEDMICDGEKHHVVPDWTLRTGSSTAKKDAATRIPGTPAYEDGLAICISKEEHKGIHKSVDRQIEAAASGGTVAMGKAKEISGKEAAKRSGCNPKNIQKQLDRKIKTPDDALVRGVKDARKVTDEMKSQYGSGQGGANK